MAVMAHPRAGQPALPEDLIDVDAVIGAYYDLTPDPSNPDQQVVFGTSGHRGSSLDTAFNDLHIAATTQAIVEYRASQGITGPLYIGKDTHALSKPAWTTAIEVLLANGVAVCAEDDDDYTPTPAVSRAIVVHNKTAAPGNTADGIVVTPSHNPPRDGGFKYNPPHGGPADSDATGVIAARANELMGDPSPIQRKSYDSVRRRHQPLRLSRHVLRGPGQCPQPQGGTRGRRAHRRRSDGRCERPVLELHRRQPGHRSHRDQSRGRSAVRVHDSRHRRQDPDGLLLAERHGLA